MARLTIWLMISCLATVCLGAMDMPGMESGMKMPGSASAAAQAPTKPQPESTRRMVAWLAAIPRDVDPLVVPYFAGKAADLARRKFTQAKTPGERASLQWRYASALLNDGRSEECLQAIDELERILAQNGLSPQPGDGAKIKLLRAITWLRMGEQENCLSNHNADSCLLAIRGGGVHKQTRGSEGPSKSCRNCSTQIPTPTPRGCSTLPT